MVVFLVPLVGAFTVLLAWQVGLWIIVTIYFYWQWWHYTRQSRGISRAFRRADPQATCEDGWLDQAIFYSMPVCGILLRSSEDHSHFIGMELWTLPVTGAVATGAGYAASFLVAVCAARRLLAAFRGRLAAAHTLFVSTHFAIFGVAYAWTPDITLGWLMINIWHNFQYILQVWMFNNRRFEPGLLPLGNQRDVRVAGGRDQVLPAGSLPARARRADAHAGMPLCLLGAPILASAAARWGPGCTGEFRRTTRLSGRSFASRCTQCWNSRKRYGYDLAKTIQARGREWPHREAGHTMVPDPHVALRS